MRVHVLGTAAGGGLPQWNCGCPGCVAARSGSLRPRTQDSVAVSVTGDRWVLLNASPDLRQQLAAHPELHPRVLRESPIDAVVLTSADIDHCLGLFTLREGSPLAIYSSAFVLESLLRHDALCRTLERQPDQTRWIPLEPGRPQALLGARGQRTGLLVEVVPVPGKLPPHLKGLVLPHAGQNLALLVRPEAGGATLGYAPGVGGNAAGVQRLLAEANLVLFDGTFWSDDELVRLGIGHGSAVELAHWPLSGPNGSLATLSRHPRVWLTHVNNTNPILLPGLERRAVEKAGVEIADDGLELSP
jgi:pyrroloquinoline quinone biosynthesis protein B